MAEPGAKMSTQDPMFEKGEMVSCTCVCGGTRGAGSGREAGTGGTRQSHETPAGSP